MTIKPQACPRCGGSGYDPERFTYSGAEPCAKCEGGGTMVHVRRNLDYEHDLAFVDFEHRKLKGVNYSLDNPEYADKTQRGSRTFLTGGRTLDEAYTFGKLLFPQPSAEQQAANAEVRAFWQRLFPHGRVTVHDSGAVSIDIRDSQ